MKLTPFRPKRFTDSELFTTEINHTRFVVKCYLGDDAVSRRNLELKKLKRWKDYGFNVPNYSEESIDSLTTPHLLIEFVSGINLSDYLRDPYSDYTEKRSRLEKIYLENARRHRIVLDQNESMLIHTDPNTDNVLLLDDGHVTIDFEHPTKDKLAIVAVTQELANFSRRALTDLGREHVEDVASMVMHHYQCQKTILDGVCDMTLSRNFQFYHRYKDYQKKAKDPYVVTRYDFADALRAELDL